MSIIVCAGTSWTPGDPLGDQRNEVGLRNLPTKISDYDRNALEAGGASRRRRVGGAGRGDGRGEPAVKTLRKPSRWARTRATSWTAGGRTHSTLRSARVLAKVIAELGEPDMIMCGQVLKMGTTASRSGLAQLLDIPYLAPVRGRSR